MLLGVDTGGTFTDFVLYDGRDLRIDKVLSTPKAPEQAILEGLRRLGVAREGLQVVHGSTVATNALLEGKGARTVFITNRGLRDLLTVGRQARTELYNLQPRRRPPPVPRALCLEAGGRLGPDGAVIDPLLDVDLDRLHDQVRALKPQAVAVCLLFSYLDDRFERAIERALPQGLFISRSSAVLREYREYERAVATWLNAYVGPLVDGYLRRLAALLAPARLTVMQSSGETCAAERAGRLAVNLLLSGPAGGLQGARHLGRLAGHERLLSFDMGGTSTDVALIDGQVGLSSEGRIGGYPLGVPMVDMHTIGAGGGSIAYVDEGGLLQVGPRSAGAEPGPACYGAGGREPTVTDANLMLGRLPASARLGGEMGLDLNAAREALAPVARAIGAGSLEAAAEGVLRIANEHMAQALRVISVQRGLDPRDFVLMCFGGAGGLHVCELARMLGMGTALVPIQAGVLSALGMLVAPRGRQLSRTLGGLLAEHRQSDVDGVVARLAAEGRAALTAEGVDPAAIREEPSLDLCYRGQSYTLNLAETRLDCAARGFHELHQQRYGHCLDVPLELINVRLALKSPEAELSLPRLEPGRVEPVAGTPVYGIDAPVPLFRRPELGAGQELEGPCIVTEAVATTFVAPGWRCSVDEYGNLHLQRRS